MEILALILFFIVMAAGLILLVFGLPGTWVILIAAALFDWITGNPGIGWGLLGLLLLLATIGELVEFISGILGAKKYDASGQATVAAFIGGIVGAVIFAPIAFGLGAILGAFLGAFTGAFAIEYIRDNEFRRAWRSGLGALIGRVLGFVTKFAIALGMIVLIVSALF